MKVYLETIMTVEIQQLMLYIFMITNEGCYQLFNSSTYYDKVKYRNFQIYSL